MKKLNELTPGTRFHIPGCGLTGVLLAISPGGVTVRYDGVTEVEVPTEDGRKTFKRPNRPIVIAGGCEVQVL
jgi:hypothetical protein